MDIEYTQDDIDAFVKGKLSPEEHNIFLQKLKENEALANAVAEAQFHFDVSTRLIERDLRKMLNDWEAEKTPPPPPAPEPSPAAPTPKAWLWAAAAIAAVAVAWWLWPKPDRKPEQLDTTASPQTTTTSQPLPAPSDSIAPAAGGSPATSPASKPSSRVKPVQQPDTAKSVAPKDTIIKRQTTALPPIASKSAPEPTAPNKSTVPAPIAAVSTQKRADDAIKEMKQIRERTSRGPGAAGQTEVDRCNQLISAEKYDEAIQCVQAIPSTPKGDAYWSAQVYLGDALFLQRKFIEAEKTYLAAQAGGRPYKTAVFWRLAEAYRAQGKSADQETHLKAALTGRDSARAAEMLRKTRQ